MEITKNREWDAYHEAGHAVVADYYDLLWYETSIVRSEDKTRDGWIFAEDFPDVEENCIKAAAYFMEGAMSMMIFTDCDATQAIVCAENDIIRVNNFCKPFKTEDDWMLKGMKEAERILLHQDNQRRIETLLELLLEKDMVTRDVYLEALKKQQLTHK